MSAKVLPQYIAAVSAAGGAFIMGVTLGWANPAEKEILDGAWGFKVSINDYSWMSSSVTIGAAFTSIPIGFVVNSIGRKVAMLLILIPMVSGWLLLWGGSVLLMCIGRFLLGVAAGSFCLVAPIYTGEIAQKEIRGKLGTMFPLMINLGILFVFVAGAFMHVVPMTILCLVLSIVIMLIFAFMPESPIFLIKRNKMDKAIKSMRFLRGDEYDFNAEISEIQEAETKIQANPVSVCAALRRHASLKALAIEMGLFFFQQMCGINAVTFYSTDIFEVAHTGINPKISTIIIGVVQVIITVFATTVVDRLGRRALLLASASLMGLCTAALGLYFYMQDKDANSMKNFSWFPLISLCVFIVVYSIGFGPIPWVLMGELFASDVKGVAASIASTVNCVLAFVVTKEFPVIKETIGPGPTFWLFSVCSFISVIFVYFIVLETKGKSLNEIQKILEGEQAKE